MESNRSKIRKPSPQKPRTRKRRSREQSAAKAGLRKRGSQKRRRADDGSDSSRSPTRRRLAPSSPGSPPPYPLSDDISVSSRGKTPPTPTSSISDGKPPLTDEEVYEFHRKGTEYQGWIADPNLGGCQCEQSTTTMFELFNNSNTSERFTCPTNHFDDPPAPIHEDLEELGLPIKEHKYRLTRLLLCGCDEEGYRRETEYRHTFMKGVMIGECIYRFDGPHWSDIAIAQYKFDHPIDTLHYLYFTNVENDESLHYVQQILYPRHEVRWPWSNRIERQTWEYDTDEYKEILGTKLGKAAACLVLGAWDRGTYRIARVHTLSRTFRIHLRFDIEAIPAS
ncbi:hypothetical protein N7491_006435 [Penicillium cf. griseofulvum]|uniref:Uncharacterized protein n=1 Tax=Penicillium cf. griseofulvum TaxID=2972120 RepID=A0A9W9M205_9EURO|nr:hypothetical protein N7472_010534 [Penicillium cf. griseofulvum]KAJ5429419.1 hypothetical protein N7491_006435 [Penicillium cf. griseofulvum]